MTAKEAREIIRNNYGYEGAARIYEYIQIKLQEAALATRFGCEVKCPNSSFFVDSKGETHQIAKYPRI